MVFRWDIISFNTIILSKVMNLDPMGPFFIPLNFRFRMKILRFLQDDWYYQAPTLLTRDGGSAGPFAEVLPYFRYTIRFTSLNAPASSTYR